MEFSVAVWGFVARFAYIGEGRNQKASGLLLLVEVQVAARRF